MARHIDHFVAWLSWTLKERAAAELTTQEASAPEQRDMKID